MSGSNSAANATEIHRRGVREGVVPAFMIEMSSWPDDAPHGRIGARDPAPLVEVRRVRRLLVRLALVVAAALYVTGAFVHASRNIVKRQGDQTAYVQYAKDLHANWSGRRPPIVGDRNRMPLYPAFQALFYTEELTDEGFFQRGKATSIVLSVGLLAAVYLVAGLALPRLPRTTLTATAAFTCFIFKAGYFQAELLYYTLHFVAFVVICRLLSADAGPRLWAWAVAAGAAAAISHLAKAAAMPLVVLGAMTLVAGAFTSRGAAGTGLVRALLVRAGVAAVVVVTFLLVLAPYLMTSKRVFGHYFYNVNSTFYIWYDDWGDAIKGTRAHGDREGWPRLPADQLPGPAKYWREHTVGQIAARIGGGFRQMWHDLWSGYWVIKFAMLSVGFALVAAWRHAAVAAGLIRAHLPLCGFVVAYFVVSLTLAAFYAPISGTGVARFTLAHYLPLLFVMAAVRWHRAFAESAPHGEPACAARAEWFMAATLALDVPFAIWPRLLTTYGGY
jgi:hypothetical protein